MKGITLGRVAGIPIRLNWTFLVVLPLFAWLIGQDVANLVEVLNAVFGTAIDSGSLSAGLFPFVLGGVAAVGLFACVLLHELGHSAVAMYYGFDIDSITLWLFGGVAQFTEIPEAWETELQVAIAGPIVSILLGVVGWVGVLLTPGGQDVALFLFGYLALMNVTLAAFNMLPGFPMDGGRVLRALLARNRPYPRATQIAAEVGKGFAFLLGLFGLLQFNLYLVALAFFIYMGAAGEAQQTVMRAAFRGVTVRDIMTPRDELKTIAPDESVADLVERMFRERHTGYPVIEADEVVGMVTLQDAQSVRDVERDAMTVADVMTRDVATISPDADALDALTEMQQRDVGRLPVVDEAGELVGIISRTDLMTAFDIIQSSGSPEALKSTATGPSPRTLGR